MAQNMKIKAHLNTILITLVAMLATALFFILIENRDATFLSLKTGGPTTVEGVADLIESATSACELGPLTSDFGKLESVFEEAGTCTVSGVRIDITTHPDRAAMFEAIQITDEGVGCSLSKARDSDQYWIVSDNRWSIFLAKEELAMTIASHAKATIFTRFCIAPKLS